MSEFDSKIRLSGNTQRVVSSTTSYLSSVSKLKYLDATPSTISTKGTSTTASLTPDTHGRYSACNKLHTHEAKIETETGNPMLFKEGNRIGNNHIHNRNFVDQKNKVKQKDASDILAQWRKERQVYQRLQDKENVQNGVGVTHVNNIDNSQGNDDATRKDSTQKCRNIDVVSKLASLDSLQESHCRNPEGPSIDNDPVRNRKESSAATIDHEGLEGVDTSVMTTPTGNTALNSVGMERLHNKQSSRIRLFPASQDRFQPLNKFVYHDKTLTNDRYNKGQELRFKPIDNSEFHEHEGDSIDVSLMTQDTDMIFLEGASRDVGTKIEASNKPSENLIQKHQENKLLSHDNCSQRQISTRNSCDVNANYSDSTHTANTSSSDNSYHNGNGTTTHANQNDFSRELSTLQSSLEQSIMIRARQEKELIQNKDIIAQLNQQNQSAIKESQDYKNSLRSSVGELMQHINGLQVCLNFDNDGQHGERSECDLKGIEKSADETRILREISNVMKQLVSNKMPHLLEQLHQNKDKVQAAKVELNKISVQVCKAKERQEEQIWQREEEWMSRQQQINQEHIRIQNQIKYEKKKLELVQKDLLHSDQVSARLQDTQQKLEQHKITLLNITTQVSEKREELADIEKICDERIQSAHSIENNARESVKEAQNEKQAATKLHDTAVKQLDTAQIERRELDSDRLAWDAELSVKHDQMAIQVERLDEERQRLKGIEESLVSRRSQLKEESDRVKSVQNQLLEIEAVTEEKLLMLDEKEAGLKKREADVFNADEEITERRKKFDLQIEENVTRSNELVSIEADLNKKLFTLQQNQEEFRGEQHNFLERLKALEKREIELESDRNELTIKASKLSTTVKSAKEDTEKRRQQLDQFDYQLNEKEKSLAQQSSVLITQKNEVTENLKELAIQKENMANDRLNFEETFKEKEAEHVKSLALIHSSQTEEEKILKSITQKKIETEKSYKKLCSDVIKVKEAIQNKVNDAQSEFQGIDNTVTLTKKELAGLQEMAQNLHKKVDDLNKAKGEITENIRRKEKKLLKVDARLTSGKETWECAKHEKEIELENMIRTKRQEAENQFTIIKDQTVSNMMKINNDLAFKQEEASCKLSSRARQLDLLHSKLSKVTRRNLLEQKQLQEDRCAWEDEKSRLEKDLEENLELIRHKDGEISSYIKVNTALKASLESSTSHELILTESLQTKDKEMNSTMQDKTELSQRVTYYEDQLSNLRRSTAELEKVYEDKVSTLKVTTERDMKVAVARHDTEKRILDEKMIDYENQLTTLKFSTAELEKVYEEKISLLKVTAERDMKLALKRHDAKVVSFGKIDVRMKELDEEEHRLEKDREDLMKRTDVLQKMEEDVDKRIVEIERKESELESEAKEVHHSKLLLQEERQLIYTKEESLRQKDAKLQDEKLEFSARQETCQKETIKESAKLGEYRQIVDLKQKQINEKEESLEKRTVELNKWESKLSDSSTRSDKKVTEVQTTLLEQEKELKAARSELSGRINSIKDLEEDLKSRTISLKRQEEAMTSKFNKISEKVSLEQERVAQAQQSLKEERNSSCARLKELKTKEDEMDSRIKEIKNQQTSNAETAKRLKEFALSLKKKDRNIQNIARLLKEQKTKNSSSDATLIAELQKAVSIEQKQYQELVEINTKQKEDIRAKEEKLNQIEKEGDNTDASEESQQRMRQIALQLKMKAEELKQREETLEEKAEELGKQEEVLAERILQCDECESTLAAWNMNLDGIAPTFDSTPENNIFRR